MDRAVTPRTSHTLRGALAGALRTGRRGLLRRVALCLLALPGTLPAQTLPADPTRPPPGFDPTLDEGALPENRLQSIVIPRQGKPRATIDGRVVTLGETLAGAGGRLARVTETHVVVDGPDGQEKLFLTPAVEKRVAVNTTNRKRTRE